MKKVFGSHDPTIAGFVQAVLQERGIACMVRNGFLQGGVGELPPNECWPEVWIVEDADLERARAVVAELAPLASEAGGGVAEGEPWRCPECGEWIEGQFTACWRCAEAPPAGP